MTGYAFSVNKENFLRLITENSVDSAVLHNVLLALADLARQADRAAWDLAGAKRKRVLALKHVAHSALNSARAGRTSLGENELLLALSHFSRQANGVAHRLPEPEQGPVFALKHAALSVLLLCKAAILY